MKKLITLMVAVILTATTFAQLTGADKKAAKLLDKNMESLTEFSTMIANDFTRQNVAGDAVSGKTFKMGAIITMSAYGDEALNKTADGLEKELNTMLGNSTWVFTPFVEFTTDTKVTVTGNGETNVGTYSQSTDIFLKIDDLIKGFPIEAVIHQNKKDKNNYIIVFPAPGGTISVAAEFNITTDKATKATGKIATPKADEVANTPIQNTKAAPVVTPAAVNEAKTKAKNALNGKGLKGLL